jgi:hypothetical protein
VLIPTPPKSHNHCAEVLAPWENHGSPKVIQLFEMPPSQLFPPAALHWLWVGSPCNMLPPQEVCRKHHPCSATPSGFFGPQPVKVMTEASAVDAIISRTFMLPHRKAANTQPNGAGSLQAGYGGAEASRCR